MKGTAAGSLSAVLLAACVPKEEACTDLDGSGVPQCAATFVGEQVQRLREGGTCPSDPPAEVVRLDGTPWVPDPVVSEGPLLFGRIQDYGPDSPLTPPEFSFSMISAEFLAIDPALCADFQAKGGYEEQLYAPGGVPMGQAYINPHLDADTLDELLIGGKLDEGLPGIGWAEPEPEVKDSAWAWYFWSCIDEFEVPPDAVGYAPATWHGSFFGHAELWRQDDGYSVDNAQVYDMFVRYGDVNCAYGEDAGYYTGWKGYDKAPFDCDGYDNDMDGVVDEGAADLDANGVADCIE